MSMSEGFKTMMTSVRSWWQEFDLKALSERIGGSSAEAVQAALCFGSFFALGLFIKKYCKFLISTLVILVITMKLLEYNDCITIHWDTIKSLLGIVEPFDLNTLIKVTFAWMKVNILLTVAMAIGFLVGYKLG